MTLTTDQAIYVLAALAVLAGLWAAYISVGSARRGHDWVMSRLPGQARGSLVAAAVGAVLAVAVDPFWMGLGVAYLAGVIAWTARAVQTGIGRLVESGEAEALPADRQAAVVRKASNWLLLTALLGVVVTVLDFEQRGSVAFWDLVLVGVLLVAGVLYWRSAVALELSVDSPRPD